MGNTISGLQSSILQSIQSTQRTVDKVQLALATGKTVNSALEGPQNFFTAQALYYHASTLSRLLDGIALNIRALETIGAGIDAISALLDQAEAFVEKAKVDLFSDVRSLSDSEVQAILAENPGVVYSSDTESFYQLVTVNANWATANANAQSATLNEPSGVSGIDGLTGNLTDITSQEENDFLEDLFVARSWIGASDAAVEGQWRWVGGPEDGQQFWQGTAAGSSVDGFYENWNGGEPNQSGNEDAVELRLGGAWNDLSAGNSLDYIIEWDSILFRPEGNDDDLPEEYAEQYVQLMEQIDAIVEDTHHRGLRLLDNKKLITYFNEDHTSFLETRGVDATSFGLGLAVREFDTVNQLDLILDEIRDAREIIRSYSFSLKGDLGIITTRQDFTQTFISTLKSGGDDLTVADQNEKGAEFLALDVRQKLQIEALALSSVNTVEELFA